NGRTLSVRVQKAEGDKRIVEITDANGEKIFTGDPNLPQSIQAELFKGVLVLLEELKETPGMTDAKKAEIERQIQWGQQRLSTFVEARITLEAEYDRSKEKMLYLLGRDATRDELDYRPKDLNAFQQEENYRGLIETGMESWVPERDRRNFDGEVDGKISAQNVRIQWSMASAAGQRNNTQLNLMLPFFSMLPGTTKYVPVGESLEAIVPEAGRTEGGGSASWRLFSGHLWKDGKLDRVLADEGLRRGFEEHLEYLVREGLVLKNRESEIENTREQLAETQRLRRDIQGSTAEDVMKQQSGFAPSGERDLYGAIHGVDDKVQQDNELIHTLNLRLLEIEHAVKDPLKGNPAVDQEQVRSREQARLSRMGIRDDRFVMTPENLESLIKTSEDRVARSNEETARWLLAVQEQYRHWRHVSVGAEAYKVPLGLGAGDELYAGVRTTFDPLEWLTDQQTEQARVRAEQLGFDNQYLQYIKERFTKLAVQDVLRANAIATIRHQEAAERRRMQAAADHGTSLEDYQAILDEVARTEAMAKTADRDLEISKNLLKFIAGIPEGVEIELPAHLSGANLLQQVFNGVEVGSEVAGKMIQEAFRDPRYESIKRNFTIAEMEERQALYKRWFSSQVGVFLDPQSHHTSVGAELTVRLLNGEQAALLAVETAKKDLAKLQADPLLREIQMQALDEYASFVQNRIRLIQMADEYVASSSLANDAENGYRAESVSGRAVKTLSDVRRTFVARENDSLSLVNADYELRKSQINLSSTLMLMGLEEVSATVASAAGKPLPYESRQQPALDRLQETADQISKQAEEVKTLDAQIAEMEKTLPPPLPADPAEIAQKLKDSSQPLVREPRMDYVQKTNEAYAPAVRELWKNIFGVENIKAVERDEEGRIKGGLSEPVLVEDVFVRLFDKMQLNPNERLAMLAILKTLAQPGTRENPSLLADRLKDIQGFVKGIPRNEKLGLNYAQVIESLLSLDTLAAMNQEDENSPLDQTTGRQGLGTTVLDKNTDLRVLGIYVFYAASILKGMDPKALEAAQAATVPDLVGARMTDYFKRSFAERVEVDFIFLTKMLENIAEQTRRNRASPNGQGAPVIAQPEFTEAEVALLTRDGLLSGLVEVKDKRVDFKTWLAAERAGGVTEDESTLRQRFAARAFLAWFPYAQRQVAEQPFFKFLTRDDTLQEFNRVREIIQDLYRLNFGRNTTLYGDMGIGGLPDLTAFKFENFDLRDLEWTVRLASDIFQNESAQIRNFYGRSDDGELRRMPSDAAMLRFLEAVAKPNSNPDQREIQKERASLRHGQFFGEVIFQTRDALAQYAKENGFVSKSAFEKEFPNNKTIFDWLMDHGYFSENEGIKGRPVELTAARINRLKAAYPADAARIETILREAESLELARVREQLRTADPKTRDAVFARIRANIHERFRMMAHIKEILTKGVDSNGEALYPRLDVKNNPIDRGIVSAWYEYAKYNDLSRETLDNWLRVANNVNRAMGKEDASGLSNKELGVLLAIARDLATSSKNDWREIFNQDGTLVGSMDAQGRPDAVRVSAQRVADRIFKGILPADANENDGFIQRYLEATDQYKFYQEQSSAARNSDVISIARELALDADLKDMDAFRNELQRRQQVYVGLDTNGFELNAYVLKYWSKELRKLQDAYPGLGIGEIFSTAKEVTEVRRQVSAELQKEWSAKLPKEAQDRVDALDRQVQALVAKKGTEKDVAKQIEIDRQIEALDTQIREIREKELMADNAREVSKGKVILGDAIQLLRDYMEDQKRNNEEGAFEGSREWINDREKMFVILQSAYMLYHRDDQGKPKQAEAADVSAWITLITRSKLYTVNDFATILKYDGMISQLEKSTKARVARAPGIPLEIMGQFPVMNDWQRLGFAARMFELKEGATWLSEWFGNVEKMQVTSAKNNGKFISSVFLSFAIKRFTKEGFFPVPGAEVLTTLDKVKQFQMDRYFQNVKAYRDYIFANLEREAPGTEAYFRLQQSWRTVFDALPTPEQAAKVRELWASLAGKDSFKDADPAILHKAQIELVARLKMVDRTFRAVYEETHLTNGQGADAALQAIHDESAAALVEFMDRFPVRQKAIENYRQENESRELEVVGLRDAAILGFQEHAGQLPEGMTQGELSDDFQRLYADYWKTLSPQEQEQHSARLDRNEIKDLVRNAIMQGYDAHDTFFRFVRLQSRVEALYRNALGIAPGTNLSTEDDGKIASFTANIFNAVGFLMNPKDPAYDKASQALKSRLGRTAAEDVENELRVLETNLRNGREMQERFNEAFPQADLRVDATDSYFWAVKIHESGRTMDEFKRWISLTQAILKADPGISAENALALADSWIGMGLAKMMPIHVWKDQPDKNIMTVTANVTAAVKELNDAAKDDRNTTVTEPVPIRLTEYGKQWIRSPDMQIDDRILARIIEVMKARNISPFQFERLVAQAKATRKMLDEAIAAEHAKPDTDRTKLKAALSPLSILELAVYHDSTAYPNDRIGLRAIFEEMAPTGFTVSRMPWEKVPPKEEQILKWQDGVEEIINIGFKQKIEEGKEVQAINTVLDAERPLWQKRFDLAKGGFLVAVVIAGILGGVMFGRQLLWGIARWIFFKLSKSKQPPAVGPSGDLSAPSSGSTRSEVRAPEIFVGRGPQRFQWFHRLFQTAVQIGVALLVLSITLTLNLAVYTFVGWTPTLLVGAFFIVWALIKTETLTGKWAKIPFWGTLAANIGYFTAFSSYPVFLAAAAPFALIASMVINYYLLRIIIDLNLKNFVAQFFNVPRLPRFEDKEGAFARGKLPSDIRGRAVMPYFEGGEFKNGRNEKFEDALDKLLRSIRNNRDPNFGGIMMVELGGDAAQRAAGWQAIAALIKEARAKLREEFKAEGKEFDDKQLIVMARRPGYFRGGQSYAKPFMTHFLVDFLVTGQTHLRADYPGILEKDMPYFDGILNDDGTINPFVRTTLPLINNDPQIDLADAKIASEDNFNAALEAIEKKIDELNKEIVKSAADAEKVKEKKEELEKAKKKKELLEERKTEFLKDLEKLKTDTGGSITELDLQEFLFNPKGNLTLDWLHPEFSPLKKRAEKADGTLLRRDNEPVINDFEVVDADNFAAHGDAITLISQLEAPENKAIDEKTGEPKFSERGFWIKSQDESLYPSLEVKFVQEGYSIIQPRIRFYNASASVGAATGDGAQDALWPMQAGMWTVDRSIRGFGKQGFNVRTFHAVYLRPEGKRRDGTYDMPMGRYAYVLCASSPKDAKYLESEDEVHSALGRLALSNDTSIMESVPANAIENSTREQKWLRFDIKNLWARFHKVMPMDIMSLYWNNLVRRGVLSEDLWGKLLSIGFLSVLFLGIQEVAFPFVGEKLFLLVIVLLVHMKFTTPVFNVAKLTAQKIFSQLPVPENKVGFWLLKIPLLVGIIAAVHWGAPLLGAFWAALVPWAFSLHWLAGLVVFFGAGIAVALAVAFVVVGVFPLFFMGSKNWEAMQTEMRGKSWTGDILPEYVKLPFILLINALELASSTIMLIPNLLTKHRKIWLSNKQAEIQKRYGIATMWAPAASAKKTEGLQEYLWDYRLSFAVGLVGLTIFVLAPLGISVGWLLAINGIFGLIIGPLRFMNKGYYDDATKVKDAFWSPLKDKSKPARIDKWIFKIIKKSKLISKLTVKMTLASKPGEPPNLREFWDRLVGWRYLGSEILTSVGLPVVLLLAAAFAPHLLPFLDVHWVLRAAPIVLAFLMSPFVAFLFGIINLWAPGKLKKLKNELKAAEAKLDGADKKLKAAEAESIPTLEKEKSAAEKAKTVLENKISAMEWTPGKQPWFTWFSRTRIVSAVLGFSIAAVTAWGSMSIGPKLIADTFSLIVSIPLGDGYTAGFITYFGKALGTHPVFVALHGYVLAGAVVLGGLGFFTSIAFSGKQFLKSIFSGKAPEKINMWTGKINTKKLLADKIKDEKPGDIKKMRDLLKNTIRGELVLLIGVPVLLGLAFVVINWIWQIPLFAIVVTSLGRTGLAWAGLGWGGLLIRIPFDYWRMTQLNDTFIKATAVVAQQQGNQPGRSEIRSEVRLTEQEFQKAIKDLQPKWLDRVFGKTGVNRRAATAGLLSRNGDYRAISALGDALRDESSDVRAAVVIALRDLKALSGLVKALDDGSRDVRGAAVSALRDLHALAELVKALNSEAADVRAAAIAALRELKVLAELGKELNNKYPDVRAAAVAALRELKIPAELVKALNSEYPDVRTAAIAVLRELKALTELGKELNNKYPDVRVAAVTALSALKDTTTIPELAAVLQDDNPSVRAVAIAALYELNALSELGKELNNEYPDVRMAAALALGERKDTNAVPELIKTLEDVNWSVRAAAATALEKIGDPRSAPALSEYEVRAHREREERLAREQAESSSDDDRREGDMGADIIGPFGRSEMRALSAEERAVVNRELPVLLTNYLGQRAAYNATTGTWTPVSETELLQMNFDLTMVLGSSDKDVPVKAAAIVNRLRQNNPAMTVVTSGKWGPASKLLAGNFQDASGQRIPEAVYLKEVMEARGARVDIVEPDSTSTGENTRAIRQKVLEAGLDPKRVLVMTTPWDQAKAGGVFVTDFLKGEGKTLAQEGIELVSYTPVIPDIASLSDADALAWTQIGLEEAQKLKDWPDHKPDPWSAPVPISRKAEQAIAALRALPQMRSEVGRRSEMRDITETVRDLFADDLQTREAARLEATDILGPDLNIQDMLKWHGQAPDVVKAYLEEADPVRKHLILSVITSAERETDPSESTLRASAEYALSQIYRAEHGFYLAKNHEKYQQAIRLVEGLTVALPQNLGVVNVAEVLKEVSPYVYDESARGLPEWARELDEHAIYVPRNVMSMPLPEVVAFLVEQVIEFEARNRASHKAGVIWTQRLQQVVFQLAKIKTFPIRLNVVELLEKFIPADFDARNYSNDELNALWIQKILNVLKEPEIFWLEDERAGLDLTVADLAFENGEVAEFIFAAGEATRLWESMVRYAIITAQELESDAESVKRKFRMWNLDAWEVVQRLQAMRPQLETRLKEQRDTFVLLMSDERVQRYLETKKLLAAAETEYEANPTPEHQRRLQGLLRAFKPLAENREVGKRYEDVKTDMETLPALIREASRTLPEGTTSLGLGDRHMMALVKGIRDYASAHGLDAQKMVRNKKVAISVNGTVLPDVAESLIRNDFYGLDPANVVLVINPDDAPGFSRDREKHHFVFTSKTTNYNHGFNISNADVEYLAAYYSPAKKQFVLGQEKASDYMTQRGVKTGVIHRMNDMILLDPASAVNPEMYALFSKLKKEHPETGVLYWVLNNFIGQKGGLSVGRTDQPGIFSFLIEDLSAKTTAVQHKLAQIAQAITDKGQMPGIPYNRLYLMFDWDMVFRALEANGGTLPMAIKNRNDAYSPENPSGNITLLVPSIAMATRDDALIDAGILAKDPNYKKGKGGLIHDFKVAGDIETLRQMVEYEDGLFAKVSPRSELGGTPSRSEVRTTLLGAINDIKGLKVKFRNQIGSVDVGETINEIKEIQVVEHVSITEPVESVLADNVIILKTRGSLGETPQNLVSAAIVEQILMFKGKQFITHWGLNWSKVFGRDIEEASKLMTGFLRRNVRGVLEAYVKPGKTANELNAAEIEAKGDKLVPPHFEWFDPDPAQIPQAALQALLKGELVIYLYAAGEASRLRDSFIRYGIVTKEQLERNPEMARQFRMWNLDLWDVVARLREKESALRETLDRSTQELKALLDDDYESEKKKIEAELAAARDAYAEAPTPEKLAEVLAVKGRLKASIKVKEDDFQRMSLQEYLAQKEDFIGYEDLKKALSDDVNEINMLLRIIKDSPQTYEQHLGLGVRHLVALFEGIREAAKQYQMSGTQVSTMLRNLKLMVSANREILYDVETDLAVLIKDSSHGLTAKNVRVVLNDFEPTFKREGNTFVISNYRAGYNHGANISNANESYASFAYDEAKDDFTLQREPAFASLIAGGARTCVIHRVNDLINVVPEMAFDLPMLDFYIQKRDGVGANMLVEVLNNWGQKGGLLYSDDETPAPFVRLVEGLELKTDLAEEAVELLTRRMKKATRDEDYPEGLGLPYNRLYQYFDIPTVKQSLDENGVLGWMSVKDDVSVPGGKVKGLWSPEPATGSILRMPGIRAIGVVRKKDPLFEMGILPKDKKYERIAEGGRVVKNGAFIHDFKEMRDLEAALWVLTHMDKQIAGGTISIPDVDVEHDLSKLIAGIEGMDDPAKLAEIYFVRMRREDKEDILQALAFMMSRSGEGKRNSRFHARDVAGLIIGLPLQMMLQSWNRAADVLIEFRTSVKKAEDLREELPSASGSQKIKLEQELWETQQRIHAIQAVVKSGLLEAQGSAIYQSSIWLDEQIENHLRTTQSRQRSEMRTAAYPQVFDSYDPKQVRLGLVVNDELNGRFYDGRVDGSSEQKNGFQKTNPVDVAWPELEAKMPSDPATERQVLYAYHNLYHLDWFVAYNGNARKFYHAFGEPFEERTYSMFVSWKDGTVTSEDLRFLRDANVQGRIRVYRAADAEKTDLGDKINFAVFGQRLIENGTSVPMDRLAYQFSDIPQIVNGPQFLTKKPDGGPEYGPAIGRDHLLTGPERPIKPEDRPVITEAVRRDGYVEIDLTPYLNGEKDLGAYVKEGATPAEIREAIEKGALQNWLWDYKKIGAKLPQEMKTGEYYIEGNTLHIKLTLARYPHNLIGITKSGKVVAVVLTGKKYLENGKGYTIPEIQEIVTRKQQEKGDPIVSVFLLANSKDAFKRINGEFSESESSPAGFRYEKGSAGIVVVAPRVEKARSEVRSAGAVKVQNLEGIGERITELLPGARSLARSGGIFYVAGGRIYEQIQNFGA
ncbi:MAG: HEAT repeat domain-containing protein, partial [Candidatus Omnitrophota bacterium]